MKTKIIYSPRCLEYSQPGHPESPDRVKQSWQCLQKLNYQFVKPQPTSEADILLVHSKDLVKQVKQNLASPAPTARGKSERGGKNTSGGGRKRTNAGADEEDEE